MQGGAHRFSLKAAGLAALLALAAGPWQPALAAGPKLLMFDGVDFRSQTNAQQAAYWGQTVGVQGFFLKNVMDDWKEDVRTDPKSPLWQNVARFQSTYAAAGVTDNFIKVALTSRTTGTTRRTTTQSSRVSSTPRCWRSTPG